MWYAYLNKFSLFFLALNPLLNECGGGGGGFLFLAYNTFYFTRCFAIDNSNPFWWLSAMSCITCTYERMGMESHTNNKLRSVPFRSHPNRNQSKNADSSFTSQFLITNCTHTVRILFDALFMHIFNEALQLNALKMLILLDSNSNLLFGTYFKVENLQQMRWGFWHNHRWKMATSIWMLDL